MGWCVCVCIRFSGGECASFAHTGEFDSEMIKSINQLMFACSRWYVKLALTHENRCELVDILCSLYHRPTI
jgi:hypothetical protein